MGHELDEETRYSREKSASLIKSWRTWASVLQTEVLVREALAIDGATARPIIICEVSTWSKTIKSFRKQLPRLLKGPNDEAGVLRN
jgi:hypothetical protein